jgi:RND superfamily putative drug exporter
VTGLTAINIDTSNKISAGLPSFLIVIIGLALILLMLVFRSIAVPVKAIVGFLLTIGSALGITTWVFQQGHLASALGVHTPGPIVSFLPVLLISILFGLAMDYEVFLVTRIRESHLHGEEPRRAITSGFRASARVVTAAALIMIGVFSSFVTGADVVVKSIAFALAFGVLADAFLVRMTFVPAVLLLLGRRAWALPPRLERLLPNVDIEGEHLSHTRKPDATRPSSRTTSAPAAVRRTPKSDSGRDAHAATKAHARRGLLSPRPRLRSRMQRRSAVSTVVPSLRPLLRLGSEVRRRTAEACSRYANGSVARGSC